MRNAIIRGRDLLPDGSLVETPLAMEDGTIASLERDTHSSWNAGGCLVLPGIVDVHGDAFEHLIMPRPHAVLPYELALTQADRQMVSNGITTGYYGMSYTWEPGLRSGDGARAFLTAFESAKPHFTVDSRLHLRFEIYHLDAVEEVIDWLHSGRVDLLSFNDHIAYQESKMDDAATLGVYAHRSGLSPDEFRQLFYQVKERGEQALQGVIRLAGAARDAAVPMASHDEEAPEVRQWYHDLGCTICEFPCNRETAEAARLMGDPVILGAPNVIKGESLYGRLSARRSAAEGLCAVLSSDYYYASQLNAAFLLAKLGLLPFGEAWNLVSINAAEAVSLHDRGEIAPGKRADLLVVDDFSRDYPIVEAAFVAGRLVHASENFMLNNL